MKAYTVGHMGLLYIYMILFIIIKKACLLHGFCKAKIYITQYWNLS
jgi:hypothetical protein